MELDNLDKQILNHLIDNSRLSYRHIAQKVKVSVATVMNRVNILEKSGVIKKYTLEIDHEKVGYDVEVIVDLRISHGKLFMVEKRIASHPNVCAVYDNTGTFDATVVAKFKSRRGMDEFLKKIQTYDFVERTETRLILNIIKEEPIKIS